MTSEASRVAAGPFNTPVEIGLRALCVLTAAYPTPYSMQRLVIFDYLVVHSDDVPGGPSGLHPQTPHRSGELLVRRGALQDGLMLYQSRDLVEQSFRGDGVFFGATEKAAGFLDALGTDYALGLRDRAMWVVDRFGSTGDRELETLVRENLGTWGAEFELESVLWAEEV